MIKKKRFFVILVFSLSLLDDVAAYSCKNFEPVKLENLPFVNPGYYDQKEMDNELCVQSCSNLGKIYEYALTNRGNICLCSDSRMKDLPNTDAIISKCDEQCSGDHSQACGSSKYAYSVSEIDSETVNDTQISSETNSNTDSELELVSFKDGDSLFASNVVGKSSIYSLLLRDWDTEIILKDRLVFIVPSILPVFGPTQVTKISNLDKQSKLNSKVISMDNDISYDSTFNISCPLQSPVSEEFFCNVKFSSVKMNYLSMVADDQDLNINYKYQLESEAGMLGYNPTKFTKTNGIETCHKEIYITSTRIKKLDAVLYGVQMLTTSNKTIVEIHVLNPFCDQRLFCPEVISCGDVCSSKIGYSCRIFKEYSWCPTCDRPCPVGFPTSYRLEYSVKREFSTENDGEVFYYMLDSPMEISIGSIIGIKILEGCIKSQAIDDSKFSDRDSSNNLLHRVHYVQSLVAYNSYLKLPVNISKPGIVNLTASFGSKNTKISVEILENIYGLNITLVEKSVCNMVSEEITFRVTMEVGKKLNFTIDFGDGSKNAENYLEEAINSEFDVVHTFNKSGDYKVAVKAFNGGSSIDSSVDIVIDHKIRDFIKEVKSNSPQLLPPGKVSLTITFSQDISVRSSTIEVNWCDGKTTYVDENVGLNPELILQHTYLKPMSCNATITANNSCDSYISNFENIVLEKVLGVNATIEGYVPSTICDRNDYVETYKSMTLNITYPSIDQVEQFLVYANGINIKNFTSQSTTVLLKEDKYYECKVYAYTLLQQQVENPFEFSASTLRKHNYLKITAKSDSSKLDEIHNFTAAIISKGSKPCLKVDYGDNSLEYYGEFQDCKEVYTGISRNLIKDTLKTDTIVLSHVFEYEGIYDLTSTLVNCISQENSSITNFKLGEIEEFNVVKINNSELIDRQNFSVSISDIGGRSCLMADYGDNRTEYFGKYSYCVMLYDNVHGVKRKLEKSFMLSHKYKSVGFFNPTFTISNTMYNKSVTIYNITIGEIGDFSVLKTSNTSQLSESVSFLIMISEISNKLCLKVEYGDNSTEYFGLIRQCKLVYDDVDRTQVKARLTTKFTILHEFRFEGSFNPTFIISNVIFQKSETISNVLVGEMPCSKIDFWIEEMTNECFFSSKVLSVSVKSRVVCEKSDVNMKKEWTIAKKDSQSEIIPLVDNNKTTLVIPENTLTTGTYILNFTVELMGLPFKFSVINSTTFCTKLSPLEGAIIEGIAAELTIGLGQSLIIDPIQFSKDPNSPSGIIDPISVLLCRKIDETFNFDMDKVTKKFPADEMTNGKSISNIDSYGCFGDGKFAINTASNGSFEVDSSSLINPVGTYMLTGIIGSCIYGECRFAKASVTLNTVLSVPPKIVLQCNFPSKCNPKLIDGEQTIIVNKNDNVGLNAVCLESCPKNSKFEVFVSGSLQNGLNFNDSQISVVQTTGRADITVLRNFYFDFDIDPKFYISVKYYDSRSKLIFRINRNPINGRCWIEKIDNCLIESLTIKCDDNWYDPDGGEVISYQSEVIGKDYICEEKTNSPQIECFVSSNITYAAIYVYDSDGGRSKVEFSNEEIKAKICRPVLADVTNLLQTIKNQGEPKQVTAALNVKAQNDIKELETIKELAPVDDLTNNLEMVDDIRNERISNQLDMLVENEEFAESSLNNIDLLCTSDRATSENKDKCTDIFQKLLTVKGSDSSSSTTVNNVLMSVTSKMMANPTVINNAPPEDDSSLIFGKAPKSNKDVDEIRRLNDEKQSNVMNNVFDNLYNQVIRDDATNYVQKNDAFSLEVSKISLASQDSINVGNLTDIGYMAILNVTNGMYGQQEGSNETVSPSHATTTLSIKTKGKAMNTSDIEEFSVIVTIPRDDLFSLPPEEKATLKGSQTGVPHRCSVKSFDYVLVKFIPPKNYTSWFIRIKNVNSTDEDNMYLKPEQMNNRTHQNNGTSTTLYTIELNNMTHPSLFISSTNEVQLDIKVTVLENEELLEDNKFINISNADVVTSFAYHLSCSAIRCGYFDEKEKKWKTTGLKVDSLTNNSIKCRSNHLTTFGAGFFVKPNTIDFDYVFENADFKDNLTIYLTIIVSFGLYLIILVWTRRQDKKDLEKIGATPLPDNKLEDKYIYEMLVFTGGDRNAGTDSKVKFVLSGDYAETDARRLEDPERKVLQKNGIDSFILTAPGPLGNLKYLRIWHDSSGKGKKASWYLDFIVIRDVQTKKKYEFLCHKWLAVEYGDGQIDRMLPVSGLDELSAFSHLFSTSSRRNLRDGHLWLSVFLRPPRSRFTRVQRVSSCMALLYLSMLVNIMWYGVGSNKPSYGVKVGPFVLSPAQIGIGIMSNLIVFPPSLIIITLFRKSRRRYLRPSRINEAIEKQKRKDDSDSDSDNDNDDVDVDAEENKNNENIPESKSKIRNVLQDFKIKQFTFPWWCVYVAWALTVICIGTSIFFLISYSVTFGNEKTTKWFTSLFISFLCSVFLTQPVKVIIVALIASMICKSMNQDEDDIDEDEEDPELASDEEWMHKKSISKKKMLTMILNSKEVLRAKEQREKEIKMYEVIREILCYLMFLWILLTISYGNRDPNAIMMRKGLVDSFLKPGDKYLDFMKNIKSSKKLYEWMDKVFLEEIIPGQWYNNLPPFGMKGFLNDRVNLLIGVPMLRQVRVQENNCNIHPVAWGITKNCGGHGRLIYEEKGDFREYWTFDKRSKEKYQFKYQSASTLKSLPFWGILDWYGGGGFVYPMVPPLWGKTKMLRKLIKNLNETNWIDKNTRAVFFEFAVHNAQVNMFASVAIVAEFQPGGGIIPFYRIDTMKLMRYHTDFGLFVLICEVVFVLFVIYFTIIEIITMAKERRQYFRSLSNFINMSLVVISYFGIGLFINREILTSDMLALFEETKGKGYVRLQQIAAVDQVLGYMIAFVVFLANLKFLHLLRFNKRLGVLSTALKQCASNLSSFAVCLLIVFLSFVQLFYLLLHVHMAEYSTFISSVESTFSMMLGKFRFHQIQLTSPFLGPFIFFIFGLATSLVLINILLTIVISTFQEVKKDMSHIPNDYEMVEFILNKVRTIIGLKKKARIYPKLPDKINNGSEIKDFSNKIDKLLSYVNGVSLGSEKKNIFKGNKNPFLRKVNKPRILEEDDTSNATYDDI